MAFIILDHSNCHVAECSELDQAVELAGKFCADPAEHYTIVHTPSYIQVWPTVLASPEKILTLVKSNDAWMNRCLSAEKKLYTVKESVNTHLSEVEIAIDADDSDTQHKLGRIHRSANRLDKSMK